jgi:hypothetical protein
MNEAPGGGSNICRRGYVAFRGKGGDSAHLSDDEAVAKMGHPAGFGTVSSRALKQNGLAQHPLSALDFRPGRLPGARCPRLVWIAPFGAQGGWADPKSIAEDGPLGCG